MLVGGRDGREQVVDLAAGRGYGHICLQVGRVLIYVEDRDSLNAWQGALRQAVEVADAALGPVLPPGRYDPT